MQGEIRPIIKNKRADKNDPASYRPIMNSSNLYKILEYCLIPIFEKYLKIDGRQFSFQKGVGCLSAASLLKENILNYNFKHSDVHCAQIDFSKAFDKINLYIFLLKLIESNIPGIIILLLFYIFNHTYVCVSFCGVKGSL